MFVHAIRWISLLSTAVTLGALTTHVLELPNQFLLDGPLWLTVQQHLHRGWGVFTGLSEITALVSSWLLLFQIRMNRAIFGLTMLACLLLSVALAVFFMLNVPANAAISAWTATSLPPDWASYRLRWETGHVIGFICVLIALLALLRALFRDALSGAFQTHAGF